MWVCVCLRVLLMGRRQTGSLTLTSIWLLRGKGVSQSLWSRQEYYSYFKIRNITLNSIQCNLEQLIFNFLSLSLQKTFTAKLNHPSLPPSPLSASLQSTFRPLVIKPTSTDHPTLCVVGGNYGQNKPSSWDPVFTWLGLDLNFNNLDLIMVENGV